jgi:hypothetical protein
MKFTRDQLQNTLRNGVHVVTFTKVDGTVRKMHCTLDQSYLPEFKQTGNRSQLLVEANPHVLAVYDTSVKDWRSFRIDSVIDVVAEYQLPGDASTLLLG